MPPLCQEGRRCSGCGGRVSCIVFRLCACVLVVVSYGCEQVLLRGAVGVGVGTGLQRGCSEVVACGEVAAVC